MSIPPLPLRLFLLWIFRAVKHPDAPCRSGGWSADKRPDEARVCVDVSSYIQRLESFSCRFRRAPDEEWRRLFRASYVIFPRLAACCDHQFQSVWRDINVHTCILIYINIPASAVNFVIYRPIGRCTPTHARVRNLTWAAAIKFKARAKKLCAECGLG